MSDMDERDRSRESGRDRDRSRRGGGDRSRTSDGGRDRSPDRGHDRGGRKSSSCRVYVSNISYECRWQDLKDLFRSQVGDVAFVELFVDEKDRPKGCGIVEFSDAASVKKCMEVMHRFDVRGRKLVIKEDFGNERDKYGNVISGKRGRDRERDRRSDDWDDARGGDGRRGAGGISGGHHRDNAPPSLLSNMVGPPDSGADFKWDNTYGLSPQFLKSLNIHRPLVTRVFVANLDYKVDEKKLREVFKLCGKVIDVELYHDKEGNSKGFAVVDYDHPVESVQAISMLNNQMLYDRLMTVRMDRIENSDMPLRLPEGLKGVGMGLGVNGEPLRDVSRNLPSSTTTPNQMQGGGNANMVPNSGAGLLGAVPAAAAAAGLQGLAGNLGSALTSVVNAPTLASLASSNSALQSTLQSVQQPFLNQSLSNELNLAGLNSSSLNAAAASLVNSSLQNQTLGSLANAQNQGGVSGLGMSAQGMMSMNYGRQDGSMFLGASQNQVQDGGRKYGQQSGRDYDSGGGMRGFKNEPDDYRSSGNVYSTVNNGSQSRGGSKNNGFSDTIHIGNLPITATPIMLREKCSIAGDVQYVEIKSKDSAIVQFASEWQAERAIKLLDQCRIDGRTIDVRFFY